MLVKEVMTKPVISIENDKTVLDACNKYKDFKVGCLTVVDRNGFCVGIVTERDLIERSICMHKDPEKTRIDEIMSTNVKTTHPLEKIEKALEIMKQHKIKKLPVVSNDRIIGIITVTDISKAKPDISKRFIESWVKSEWKD
jgi:CBS domain-containing protein